jgi:hypothetical protein
MKNNILTGKDLKDFLELLSSNTLFAQCLIGIYAPTMLTINNRPDIPLDRSISVIIRLTTNNLDFIDTVPSVYLRKNWTAVDLIEAWNNTPIKHRIKVGGKDLNLESYGHLGVIMMRGYSAARKLLLDDGGIPSTKKPTRQSSAWIGLIIYCLKTRKSALIEQVIAEEIAVHDVEIEEIMKKGWKAIEKIDV